MAWDLPENRPATFAAEERADKWFAWAATLNARS